MPVADLAVEAFLVLRRAFFDPSGRPLPFSLRAKANTQDDPFDEHVHALLSAELREDAKAQKAPGPLITPDIVLFRPQACSSTSREALRSDSSRILGLEVKKLERVSPGGPIARASGMDFNSTPPCGTVRSYDRRGRALDMRGFYLFVCLERQQEGRGPGELGTFILSALALCDGDLLNADFEYYLAVAGERSKQIGVGTYGDGANRVRPMVIFANPLGSPILDRSVTLVHRQDRLEAECPELRSVGMIRRTAMAHPTALQDLPETRAFTCYRLATDGGTVFDVLDPFAIPKRTEKTSGRGKFVVQVEPGA